ncbi:glycine cleavage system protein H [Ornatilinea apprima]|uniref:Glycine cleavage system H protein n=1 Tax=Ornatilinea apprima TaxID=1134406 RepID=A0A0P6YFX1_9CHLR|nr:glycine cleavage system protein GcvH [Ornatilinea apprima]KPL81109.1 glycine cleavage system protein H [Ornatilinea apprima]
MKIPGELKYTKGDEWVKVEGNIATIGITDYAQDHLSDVVFVEISVSVDDMVKAGTTVATLESVKAAADVNAPVSGKVVEVNEGLADAPDTVNSDPYAGAWMLKVEMSAPAELDALMDAAAYEKYCEERES